MTRLLGVLLLTLACAACASPYQATYDRLNSLIGTATIADAIGWLGPSTYERTEPNGERLLVWERVAQHGNTVGYGYGVYTTHELKREVWTGRFGPDSRLRAWTHRPMH